jgi:hypothetical protein
MTITSCCFFLGILYADWPYNHYLLWEGTTDIELRNILAKKALDHYVNWLEVPKFIPYTMYGVLVFGFFGLVIKIFKPKEDIKYFEYGSFFVYVLAVCCYIANIRFGVYSAQAGQWGDVDEFTGLAVIAASEVIVVFLLFGLVIIQSGLFYAKYEDDKVKTEFLLAELRTKLAQLDMKAKGGPKSVPSPTSTAQTTGASKKRV